MDDQFCRTRLLLGQEGMAKLEKARVAVFGVGGVGGFTAEALARSGVGRLDLIDSDKITVSNINRQVVAFHSTVGRLKTEVMRDRILDINPAADVRVYSCFFLPENAAQFPFGEYSYIADAVDTITAKLELAVCAARRGVPLISSMGAGNKLDPAAFEVADIYETSVCPLARVMRRELKKRGIEALKVVYSREQPMKPADCAEENGRRAVPGSVSFVPSVAGLIMAGEIIRDLAGTGR